ncbi:MAG: transglutaminase domain-containing protein, partial [Solirubrobacterales bacterium]|nr:transglutaminase domain-containing protein [Solirubrobacterales bacterium]
VPYRGLDEWTRTVLAAGGTVLVVLAAGLAFWPRSKDRTGYRAGALLVLVVLYVVPTVALLFEGEFARGALLMLLVVAFLRLERLRRRDAGPAGTLALAVVVLGLLMAPVLDRSTPWWDYETWALSAASAKATSFSWDHDYGPLNWPRDGRELLRVKSQSSAYWKAENLDFFDGTAWRRAPYAIPASVAQVPDPVADMRGARRWNQRIRVSVRNLVSSQLITAGTTRAVDYPRAATLTSAGVTVAAGGRPIRRGDSYAARVYTPDPTPAQLRVSGVAYDRWLDPYRLVRLPGPRGINSEQVSFPAWGLPREPQKVSQRFPGSLGDAGDEVAASSLGRVRALALRLRLGADNPYEYVRRVEQYLGQDAFTYTESPPPSAVTLDGFLFDARQGYCQQYSGAMALLLRMGGIPARVSAGFTSGSFDKKEREWVVRDFDAHSWVEAWFPGYGWVTFDPTPSSAPPRSQASAAAGGSGPVPGRTADVGLGDRVSDPRSGLAAVESSTPWTLIALAAGAAAVLLALVLILVRRRRRRPARQEAAWAPSLAELERALRRSGRGPRAGMTLNSLEAAFSASPKAAAYVRALREQRYRDVDRGPTPAQRRGLRAELARGSGFGGRLRAWWALPPRI